ncbi:MAG: hypothetical protein WCA77_03610 [Thermoplasmata archaeon]
MASPVGNVGVTDYDNAFSRRHPLLPMFSRREREFLRLLVEGPPEATAALLARRFPNPAYRRRLLWGIRKKATAASEDWELYARAATREARVVRPRGPEREGRIPSYTEPLASLYEWLVGASRVSKSPTNPKRNRT